jgi:molecular chaperone GrpE
MGMTPGEAGEAAQPRAAGATGEVAEAPGEAARTSGSEQTPTEADSGSQRREIGSLKAELRAALGELEASRRRIERERERLREGVRAEVLTELLPLLDDLERSIKVAAGRADTALLEGLGLVRDGFGRTLTKLGAERIDAEGQPFDPRVHEAISVVVVDEPTEDGRVVKQWCPGYRLPDRILRPAQVVVGKRQA